MNKKKEYNPKTDDMYCPECGKIFTRGDTVAIDQHGTQGCNVCSYKKNNKSCFISLIYKGEQ